MKHNAMHLLPVIGPQNGAQEYWEHLLALGAVEDHTDPQYIVVLGGDGTMLGAQEKYAQHHVPFIGVGFGSANFLLNRGLRDPEELYAQLQADAWCTITSQALRVEVESDEGAFVAHAFNDVYMKSQNPAATICMRVYAEDDFPKGLVLQGDGVIVANPTGSTAYTKNAGGSVLPLKSPLWAMTGICTKQDVRFTLGHQKIAIELERSRAAVVADNRVYNNVLRVVIVPSDIVVTILFTKGEDINQRRYGS